MDMSGTGDDTDWAAMEAEMHKGLFGMVTALVVAEPSK